MDLFTSRCGCGVIFRPAVRTQKTCTDCQHRHAQTARAKLGTDKVADQHTTNRRFPYQRPYTVDEIRQGTKLIRDSEPAYTSQRKMKTYDLTEVKVEFNGKACQGFTDGGELVIEPVQETYKPRHLARPQGGSMTEALKALKDSPAHDLNRHRAQSEQSFRALLVDLKELLQPRVLFGVRIGDLRHEAHCWLRERLPIHAQIIVTTSQDLGTVTMAIEVNGGRLGSKLTGVLTLQT